MNFFLFLSFLRFGIGNGASGSIRQEGVDLDVEPDLSDLEGSWKMFHFFIPWVGKGRSAEEAV